MFRLVGEFVFSDKLDEFIEDRFFLRYIDHPVKRMIVRYRWVSLSLVVSVALFNFFPGDWVGFEGLNEERSEVILEEISEIRDLVESEVRIGAGSRERELMSKIKIVSNVHDKLGKYSMLYLLTCSRTKSEVKKEKEDFLALMAKMKELGVFLSDEEFKERTRKLIMFLVEDVVRTDYCEKNPGVRDISPRLKWSMSLHNASVFASKDLEGYVREMREELSGDAARNGSGG